jgi:oligosaccharide repeat unit polymerase
VLSVIPSLALLFLAWVARRQLNSWLAPSAFFALYWGVALLVPLLLAPDFNMWPGAPWLILVLGYALHLGVLVGARGAAQVLPATPAAEGFEVRLGMQLFVLAIVGGLAAALYLVVKAGFSWTALLRQPQLIAAIGLQYAGARYTYAESPSALLSLLNGVQFFAGCLLGLWIATERSTRRLLVGYVPFVLAMLQSFLVNARSGLMWMGIFVLATLLATRVLQRRHLRFVTPRRLVQAAIVVGSAVALFVVIQIIREGPDTRNWMMKTRVATLAPPMSFSHWLRDEWTTVEPTWGARTLGGVYYELGLAERPVALGWEEDLEIPVGTNLYSAFRQTIEDVTVPGMIVLFAALGLVFGLAYRRVLEGSVGWMPVLALFYAITLGSYIANWMSYNSCLFGWALFAFAVGRVGPQLLRRRSGPAPLAGFGVTHAT